MILGVITEQIKAVLGGALRGREGVRNRFSEQEAKQRQATQSTGKQIQSQNQKRNRTATSNAKATAKATANQRLGEP